MKTATNFINESSRQDFEQFVIDNKELSIKMTQKPWAYTVHKFNEVFEKTPWRIGRKYTANGNPSNYQLLYNNTVHYNLKSTNEFLHMIFDKFAI
jgi:hypothetical protein